MKIRYKKIWRFLKAEGPKVWCKGYYARRKDGHITDVHCRGAVRFCATGLLEKFFGDGGKSLSAATERLRKAIGAKYIVEWNDAKERTFAEVLSAFKKANL